MKHKGFTPVAILLIITGIIVMILFFLKLPLATTLFDTPLGTPSFSKSEKIYLEAGELMTITKYYEDKQPSYVTYYPCANSGEEAVVMAGTEDWGYKIDPVPEVQNSVKIKNYSEYFNIEYTNYGRIYRLNVINCNYFEVKINSSDPKGSALIGLFKQSPTKESLNHLVEFLFATEILTPQTCGFNCSSKSVQGIFEENNNEIIRKDKYLLKVSNDLPPFNTQTSLAEQQFILNKNTGEFRYEYSR